MHLLFCKKTLLYYQAAVLGKQNERQLGQRWLLRRKEPRCSQRCLPICEPFEVGGLLPSANKKRQRFLSQLFLFRSVLLRSLFGLWMSYHRGCFFHPQFDPYDVRFLGVSFGNLLTHLRVRARWELFLVPSNKRESPSNHLFSVMW